MFLTVVYSALAVWMLGLAVPVTASYIIAAVMVAPALVQAGVPNAAAHMFIFYYAVLSEVSPPTALSPFAAAALTGGNPFATMMLTWKYTLPAFLVPFVFTLTPEGLGILMQGTPRDIARSDAQRRGRNRRVSLWRSAAGFAHRRVQGRARPRRRCRGACFAMPQGRRTSLAWRFWLWCCSCTLGRHPVKIRG